MHMKESINVATDRSRARVLAVVGAAVLGVAAYCRLIGPRLLTWGTTPDELRRAWPGDELLASPPYQATRAITIRATPAEIWPWLMQLGQDRGGFYSYDWLENLFGADIHSIDQLIPGLEDRRVGDVVWLGRPDRYGEMVKNVVAIVQPHRALVLVNAQDAKALAIGGRARRWTWAFILEPAGERTTRLIVRSRGQCFNHLIAPIHFLMEHKMLQGIRERAERFARPAPPR